MSVPMNVLIGSVRCNNRGGLIVKVDVYAPRAEVYVQDLPCGMTPDDVNELADLLKKAAEAAPKLKEEYERAVELEETLERSVQSRFEEIIK